MIVPLLDMFASQPEQPRERIEPTMNWTDADSSLVKSSDPAVLDIFGAIPTDSGAVVNSKTAMRVSAVYSCVSLIAGAVGMMSFPIYQRTETGRERVDHDLWWYFNEQPCPEFTAAAFWELIVSQMLLRGDGLAFIERGQGGQVLSVIPIPRSQWLVRREPAPRAGMAGKLQYSIEFEEGFRGVDQADVLHFPGFGFNGLTSMSVIQWGARAAVGIALRGDEWAGKNFSQGGQPSIAVKAPGEMTQEQQEGFSKAWDRKYRNGQGPNTRPLVLTEGLDVKELSMTAADAQMLEARQWQVIDIARAFRVPPHMIGETTQATSWGSGIEHMGIGFDVYTMGPHLARIRQELNRKLWPRGTRYYIEPDSRSLMRMDGKARSDYLKAALGGTQHPGWMTQNEARKVENLPPVEGGGELSRPQPKANDTNTEDQS